MTEVWKEVPGWPDYAVSDAGQVKRIRKPRSGRGRIGMILKARIPGGAQYPRLANLEYVTRSENLRHAFVTGLKTAAGEKNSRAKLTKQSVASIKAEFTGAYGQCAALARQYGVSHAIIQDIVHGRHWADVTVLAA